MGGNSVEHAKTEPVRTKVTTTFPLTPMPANKVIPGFVNVPNAPPKIKSPFDVVLYRIIGNDLPPRHQYGQVYTNIRFILENEIALPNWSKRWVLNRIVNTTEYNKVG